MSLPLRYYSIYLAKVLLCCCLFVTPLGVASEALIVEPDDGRQPIIRAITQAKQQVMLIMYGFTDLSLLRALKAAKKRGALVQVLLQPSPYQQQNENIFALQYLKNAGINILPPNHRVSLTHQKALIIDQNQALIMTFNFTHHTFSQERNFALVIDQQPLIQEIRTVAIADSQQRQAIPSQDTLIWSPDNSRTKILNYINSAQQSLQIYAQDLTDYQIIGAIASCARRGIKVKILLSTDPSKNLKGLRYLKKAGVVLHQSTDLVIHAKVIIRDRQAALLGSINLSQPSLDSNRELSIISRTPEILDRLETTFINDWQFHSRAESML